MESMTTWTERLVRKTTRPILKTKPIYWLWVGFLLVVIGWAFYSYTQQ